jgi:LacI family transcriptional regulator
MRDVAALAGVSLATVSRVVNGDLRVDAELARRVSHAVELLGYRHDLTASSLRRADRGSASIGLVVEDVANPFFAAVHRGIEDVARRHGMLVLTGSSDEHAPRERELTEALVARSVDGLIISPGPGDHSHLARERALGVAIVCVDRPARLFEADAVLSDNAGGARAAVDRLLALGHRRVAFIGDRPEVFTSQERLAGYRRALGDHGLPEDPALVRATELRGTNGGAIARELLALADPPTAFFTAQNLITMAAVRALHELGVEHRTALIGFDDVELADVIAPAVTVVAQDPRAIGTRAAELLFERLAGHAGPAREVVLPVALIARGSGELPPPP